MAEPSYINDAAVKLAWKKYAYLWKYASVPAKQLLLKEGEICRKVFVIDKGSARTWFHHDGRDISFQFLFEGDVVTSSESFRKSVPSCYSIETFEPVALRWVDKKDMDIIKADPVLYNFMADRVAESQEAFMQHFFTYLKYSPQQRYEKLLHERPEVVKRIPLQHIASYLGITQVSLSRIRNKIII